MIKVNLLENHFAMPMTRERTDTDTSAAKVIHIEAKKSKRRLAFLVMTFIGLAAGSITIYDQRYEVVEWLEQYTGPLNLLPSRDTEASAQAAEAARQEKIRQLYMFNTYRIQERYRKFLFRVDSLSNASEKVHVNDVSLDENNFIINVFGKTENDVKEYTVSFLDSRLLEETRPDAIKPSNAVSGLKFKRNLSGTLRNVSAASDEELAKLKVNYLEVDKAVKKLQDLAKAANLKVTPEGKMTMSRGVVMTTTSGEFKLEGRAGLFLKYLNQINDIQINFEITEIAINFADPKKRADKKNPAPDTIRLKFNILAPNVVVAAGDKKSN